MSVCKSDDFIADIERQFEWYILFYELAGGDVVMRRAMHGYRDLPRRLCEPSGDS